MSFGSTFVAALAASNAFALNLPRDIELSSPPASKVGCLYTIPGVGGFTQMAAYTFTKSELPHGLGKSDYTVKDKQGNPNAKYNHQFVPANVAVSGGFLNLEVPGGQTKGPIKCAEVVTDVSDILYASVRTRAIFSTVPGTVHGNFFYKNDSQEIDIEYLTDPKSLSNPPGKQPLMLTNQANDGNPADATTANVPSPADRTSVAHEYRIDWVPGMSIFYVDGKKVKTFTKNVPSAPGSWVWNNWANGDPGFTVGPPKSNDIFKLKSIVMYYNTTSSRGTC